MTEQERNKALAKKFFDACNRSDVEGISGMYALDGVHFVAGGRLFAGTYTGKQMFAVANQVIGAFPGGLKYALGEMVAEGDAVALQVEAHGTHSSGARYNNKYAFFMRFRDGLPTHVSEYFDTEHVAEVFGS
jgi:uncharacterized protein